MDKYELNVYFIIEVSQQLSSDFIANLKEKCFIYYQAIDYFIIYNVYQLVNKMFFRRERN
jgi:hypothetical protein